MDLSTNYEVKRMSDDKNNGSVVDPAGSPENLIKADPSSGASASEGQPVVQSASQVDLSQYVPKQQYEELEKKLGEQGSELGEARSFLNDIKPLLDELQTKPELAEAIVEGKFSPDLVEAIVNNKVKIEDATSVAQAHEEVKKELGKTAYGAASKDEIEAMINQKLSDFEKKQQETTAKITKEISTVEERRQFEQGVDEFVKNTSDFPEFAEDISQWFADHPDQYDISIAYDAVKGRRLAMDGKKAADVKTAEAAKDMALNAPGGTSSSAQIVNDEQDIDKLIGRASNPNVL